ncbi:YhcN/YlaJ family sporulation lipoprotein [Virgibacillus sp. AGTR]|uniref:YhcN/YlaJ family sporulation lipoprotein n=1 Tax=Virgibacillus salarius TaxID=447199 RepID=A0A941DWB3_9BACI|nr:MULTISPECIES: YhcN/YlaJ family sporulation lipoprotein [Bacillaceae]NAZ10684.1 YhcN/YlaJ family sporulation lipoprotein [Agaribacter marinus]MBR7797975.1 YhcN/YlaJ family sporulation lipoprotein [Virgibacillus salarius]MCC2248360.1 YhcN/YlaJ family sporulation lipoprotein [Virgibacillus sp. AGTR]MDY7045219.1 YhcN/YlaJ family sporulation lipoprotein [Virgibacillus sp. M23]QRZ16424.1 YhcN/YlaJ family sporulation lipoprotein [Virgibacillus sp. AGTR]
MKSKFFTLFAVLSIVLMGCANTDDNNNQDAAEDNVEQTRYNNAGDGMAGERDYEMRRTSERDQETNNNDRYDISKEAADKITDEIAEIDRAYVVTTDNNAYVAAGLDANDNPNMENTNTNNNEDNGNEVTDEVKSKIKKIVQSVDGDIDNVYVSTNPDFLNLTQNYADDVDNGEPIEGFFDQFGNMIERLFPENQ